MNGNKEKLLSGNFALFQDSAAKQVRSVLFCVITQREVVSYFRRFGKTYRSVNFMLILI